MVFKQLVLDDHVDSVRTKASTELPGGGQNGARGQAIMLQRLLLGQKVLLHQSQIFDAAPILCASGAFDVESGMHFRSLLERGFIEWVPFSAGVNVPSDAMLGALTRHESGQSEFVFSGWPELPQWSHDSSLSEAEVRRRKSARETVATVLSGDDAALADLEEQTKNRIIAVQLLDASIQKARKASPERRAVGVQIDVGAMLARALEYWDEKGYAEAKIARMLLSEGTPDRSSAVTLLRRADQDSTLRDMQSHIRTVGDFVDMAYQFVISQSLRLGVESPDSTESVHHSFSSPYERATAALAELTAHDGHEFEAEGKLGTQSRLKRITWAGISELTTGLPASFTLEEWHGRCAEYLARTEMEEGTTMVAMAPQIGTALLGLAGSSSLAAVGWVAGDIVDGQRVFALVTSGAGLITSMTMATRVEKALASVITGKLEKHYHGLLTKALKQP